MDLETISSIAIGALLAAFSGAVVGYSYLRKRDGEPGVLETGGTAVAADMLGGENGPSLDSLFDAINTLELEYQLGNLPDGQFQEQFQAYRLQAAETLRQNIESGQGDPAWLLELEVLMARAGMRDQAKPGPVCPNCGVPAVGEARECSECGADLALAGPGPAARTSGDE